MNHSCIYEYKATDIKFLYNVIPVNWYKEENIMGV